MSCRLVFLAAIQIEINICLALLFRAFVHIGIQPANDKAALDIKQARRKIVVLTLRIEISYFFANA